MESTDRKAGASADINPVKEDESTARLSASCAMKVNGLDINVGVKGVLIAENRATCVMGHVEAIREKLVVNILRRLLQGNDMPPSDNFVVRKHLLFSVGVQGSSCRCRVSFAHLNGLESVYWNCSCEKRLRVFFQTPRETLL